MRTFGPIHFNYQTRWCHVTAWLLATMICLALAGCDRASSEIIGNWEYSHQFSKDELLRLWGENAEPELLKLVTSDVLTLRVTGKIQFFENGKGFDEQYIYLSRTIPASANPNHTQPPRKISSRGLRALRNNFSQPHKDRDQFQDFEYQAFETIFGTTELVFVSESTFDWNAKDNQLTRVMLDDRTRGGNEITKQLLADDSDFPNDSIFLKDETVLSQMDFINNDRLLLVDGDGIAIVLARQSRN